MISKTKKIPFVDDKRCLYVSVMTISQRAYSSNSVKERIFYFALLYKVDVGHSVSLSLMHEISLFHQAFQIIVMYNFLFNHRFLITHGLLYLSVAVAIFFPVSDQRPDLAIQDCETFLFRNLAIENL